MRLKYYSGHQVIDVITEFANDKDEMLNMLNRFEALETDDVEPIRHGEWVQIDEHVYCSNCLQEFSYIDGVCYLVTGFRLPHYCPNCGAKMDLGGRGGINRGSG